MAKKKAATAKTTKAATTDAELQKHNEKLNEENLRLQGENEKLGQENEELEAQIDTLELRVDELAIQNNGNPDTIQGQTEATASDPYLVALCVGAVRNINTQSPYTDDEFAAYAPVYAKQAVMLSKMIVDQMQQQEPTNLNMSNEELTS